MAEKSKFSGLVEYISPKLARGWAWNPDAPEAPVEVAAYYNGVKIASTVADLFRRDLEMSGMGTGRYGFSLAIPDATKLDESFHLKVVGSDEHLEIHENAQLAGLYEGYVECISAEGVFGWVWKPYDPGAQVDVIVREGGEIVAEATASVFRGDLEAAQIGDGRHAFWARLSREVSSDAIVVQVAGTDVTVARSFDMLLTPHPSWLASGEEAAPAAAVVQPPAAVQGGGGFTLKLAGADDPEAAAYEGYIECIASTGVFGWVWMPAEPAHRVEILVKENGAAISETRASIFRGDLLAANIGDGHHAFWARLGRAVNPNLLTVQIAGTNVTLPRAVEMSATPHPMWLSPDELAGEGNKPHAPVQARKEEAPVAPAAPADQPPASLPIPEEDYHALAAEFDEAFYRSRNAEVLDGHTDPLIHFATKGWREGRSPNGWFSVIDYLADFEDVLLIGRNPFLHYLHNGRTEGRKIVEARSVQNERKFRHKLKLMGQSFEEGFYTHQLKTIDFQFVDPLLHYALTGWRKQVDPCSWFSINDYMLSYPDVRAANIDPFFHYLSFGKAEGRQPNRQLRNEIIDAFDTDYYLSQNPPLFGLEPADHFVAFGWRQGLNPRTDFDVAYYRRMNPDVEKAGLNPFWHYVVAGKAEGRPSFPKNSRKIAPNMNLPKLLFVGHDAIHAGAEVVLLEIVKWFANHTRYPIKLLLFGTGRLVPQYSEYADTYVMLESLADVGANKPLQSFLNDKFSACYVNTVAAARFWKLFEHCPAVARTPLILHVHEMEMVIRDFEEDFRNIMPHVDSVVAVSKAVRTALTDVFHCDPAKIFLSNAFVNVIANTAYEAALRRQAARQELQLATSDFVVIGCGTVYPRKGPDLFLETAFKCLERGSIPNAKFMWIGGGEELESLRGKVASRSLSDRIRFIGVRDNANELIAAADVFFLSSREDPFPLVCMEAAQYGIPTIYFTGATGISEFCGTTAGVGVPSFDTEAALAAIHLYSSQPLRLEKAGAAARARILDGYTAQKRILEVALHLQEICQLPPSVSVIVPAYNHEKFIRDRIESILAQSILDIEIIILDDCSSDNTAQIAQEYLTDPRIRFERNEVNTGSPFIQWGKGAQMARSELIWIAEGDDLATNNFLAATLPAFDDPLVNLAFCRTEIIDEFGTARPGALDGYYKMSDFPFHGTGVKMDGLTAVEAGFGSMCLIVNGSSTIMRRNILISGAAVAQSYKMCGDWYVYLAAIADAKLVYVTQATNYFRRHSASAVHKLEGTPQYFDERFRIANYVVDTFNLSRRAFRLLTALLDGEWARFAGRNPGRTKDDMFDAPALLRKYTQRQAKPRLKIGFYVHGMLFSKGGIERLASQLANGLANLGHSVYLFCRAWGGAQPVYSLNESVKVIDVFDEDHVERTTAALRIELAKCDLDVFVPMLSEWLFEPLVDACHGLGIPIIASEHNDPGKIEELWWSRPRRLACFEKVDAVHLLLDRFKPSLPDSFQDRLYTIPNGVVVPPDDAAPHGERPRRIIGVGRLERQKRFDRLIKAFIAAAPDMPGWRLDIFGEGSERQMLQRLIDQAGLAERIALRGTSPAIPAELRASSIFVLPSEFEGFGIVILEAKQAGLPCIGYADCNGPNDLIRPEVDGLLVAPDEDGTSLAAALRDLTGRDAARQAMGKAGYEDAKRFDIRLIVQLWEKMLIAVARDKADETVSTRPHHDEAAVPNDEMLDSTPPDIKEASSLEAEHIGEKEGKAVPTTRKTARRALSNIE